MFKTPEDGGTYGSNPGSGSEHLADEGVPVPRHIDLGQLTQLSKTALLRAMSNNTTLAFASALAVVIGAVLYTQSSAKSDYEDERTVISKGKELGSFSAFSQQALKEIIGHKRGSVLQGYIEISKQVHIRTEPRIEFDPPSPNTIRWEDVEFLNGVSLVGVERFIAVDPLMVFGQDPSGMSRVAPWLAFEVQTKGILGKKRVIYISWSDQTSDVVQFTSRPENMVNQTQIGAIIPKRK